VTARRRTATPAATTAAGVAPTCQRRSCTTTDGLIGGYCSDTCLQADAPDEDDVPVTVLAPNKAGGVGRGLSWQTRQPVHLPRRLS